MDWAAFDRDMAGLPRESKTPRAGSSSVYPDLPREAEPTAKAKARVVRSSSVYPDSQIGPFRLTGLSQVSWATNTSSSYDDEQVSPCGTMYGGRDSQYNAEMRMRGLFYQPQDIPRIPAIPDNINGKDPRDTRFYKFYDQILDRQPSPPRKT
ncbi:hypothetical protein M501DRAFT_993548 [Patellaria atrata CBS 101060]|uniref:Uncharacterized protein n=1 Tax=Patellaria atrata CBS 101060 TaxID=1346257 RepID=A0A9P4SJ68_9PEZI|nr:hypothetical protein M501DRAFT_993548 [Patellaria atrata CBS 101060]